MSQGNVDIIRELWEAVNETKLPAFDLLHPEVNWQTRADLLDSDTYRGHDGVAKLAADWFGAFDDLRVEPEELIPTKAEALEAAGLTAVA